MNDYNKITALYSRLSVGDEDRDGGESNSIQNQKKFLESYARQLKLTNIRHYIDDDESGRFFDRSAYSRMIEDVENGKIGVCIMKDVYKRQTLANSELELALGDLIVEDLDFVDSEFEMALGDVDFTGTLHGRCKFDVAPVSYTHLDVYKRQGVMSCLL